MANLKLEKLLLELMKLKNKTADNKALLKNYKIKSDRLTQLLSAKKDLMVQIEEEKNRIEDEMLEDNDYADAKKTEKELKVQIKEANADIREELSEMKMNTLTASLDYVIEGEPVKVQIEKFVKFFLNGKEQK